MATQKAEFKIGDWVTWKSQASGHIKEKTGKIVEIVPEGRRRPSFVTVDGKLHHFPGLASRGRRPHTSYVVLTPDGLYWPRVKNLQSIPKEKQPLPAKISAADGPMTVRLEFYDYSEYREFLSVLDVGLSVLSSGVLDNTDKLSGVVYCKLRDRDWVLLSPGS